MSNAASHEGYHKFMNEFGDAYGSFEIWYHEKGKKDVGNWGTGWYWWPCFPGCLPDGKVNGPFPTSKDAFDDAKEA